ncbi:hypothetical protein K457DRAFT_17249 [Linnemannia elongata AG-77]|uniref:Uncharacterized protein n=1 Tax=Linnemannia elongata AG-77 TaxID=1314771 RepID=A0A197K229_9FUNG|nr:hypothetical protein K457DRAFT_17249 [Linnemannia elongata AG-77]
MVMGAKVHKLSADIEGAVDTDICEFLEPLAALTLPLGESNYPLISSLCPKVHGYTLTPPLKPHTTKLVTDLHVHLTNQVKARFVVEGTPDATLAAMFLNPGCFRCPLFNVDSLFLTRAKDLAWTALLELTKEIETATSVEPVKAPRSRKDVVDSTTKRTPKYKTEAKLDKYYMMVIEAPDTFANALDALQDFWRDLEEPFTSMSVLSRAYLYVQATFIGIGASFQQGEAASACKKNNQTFVQQLSQHAHAQQL